MDMQPIGNGNSQLQLVVEKFNKAVSIYFKNGVGTYEAFDASLIKHYYITLINKLLKLKTTPLSKETVHMLFNIYRMLKAASVNPVFVSAKAIHSSQAKEYALVHHGKEWNISILFSKCLLELDSIIPSPHQLSTAYAPAFSVKDVLVGSLSSTQQLETCLSQRFYHIPATSIPMPPESVMYVAIYQSKNFFGRNAGIRYYGKVSSYELVPRCEITEIPKKSDRMYYKFHVEWHILPEPIRCSSGGSMFSTTSLYLLLRAKEIFELQFDDLEEYMLYCSMRRFVTEKPKNGVSCNYRGIYFIINSEGINVFKNNSGVYSVSSREYLLRTGYHFKRILALTDKQ